MGLVTPRAKLTGKAKRAAAALKSFSVTLSPDGGISAGLDVEAIEGLADSGMLDSDLTDLFVALGEAARDHSTGVIFLLDEIQVLSVAQLESLIAALHRCVQRTLPITLVAAGLPQIPELAGENKSYSERLFKFPAIGKLADSDAAASARGPSGRTPWPQSRDRSRDEWSSLHAQQVSHDGLTCRNAQRARRNSNPQPSDP